MAEYNQNSFELVIQGAERPRQYLSWVPDGQGGRAAQAEFEWRHDSVALAQILGGIARAVTKEQPPPAALHEHLGRQLYQAVFTGEVGQLWMEQRKKARRHPVHLLIRIDPASAAELLDLPWEYLHDR